METGAAGRLPGRKGFDMRKTYEVLAWVIAGLVVVQAAVMVFATAGESRFIDDGGVVDKALVESATEGGKSPFPEAVGYMLHGMNGMMLIPLVGLVLLAVSFGARFSGARKWAGIVALLIVVQIFLGMMQFGLPLLGLLHGANALLLFAAAINAARLARTRRAAAAESSPAQTLSA